MNTTDTTTEPAPLPRLARLIAAVPFVGITAVSSYIAARLCGCDSVQQVKRSLPEWHKQIDAKIAMRRGAGTPAASRRTNEATIRTALTLRDASRSGPMPFHVLTRADFFALREDTRRILHEHATKQAVDHPDTPVPEWIVDDPAGGAP
jgi:hypothetical protein